MEATQEQLDILSQVGGSTDNLQVNALAGTGKTTTIQMIVEEEQEPTLCLAFNANVKKVMEERFGAYATIKTMNGLGHGVWGSTCAGKVSLDKTKVQSLTREAIKELKGEDRDKAWDAFWDIITAVKFAKNIGYIPEGIYKHAKRLATRDQLLASLEDPPEDNQMHIVDAVLGASIRSSYQGIIDFDDQIYMSALFGGSFPRFPRVLVDEAQDLSPCNHEMLGKLRGSRIISVGDPYQSIYQFRGACQDGMGKLGGRFGMKELPLSVSWRCPSEVVKNAQWRAKEFKWSREGGRVERLKGINGHDIPDGSAVICRNNAPLFRFACKAISEGRPVGVAGTDIGPRLIGIMKKFGDVTLMRKDVLNCINNWEQAKIEAGSKTAPDLAECMRIFAGLGLDLGQAVAFAEDVFHREGSLHLTTGHKAKGMEWENVFHLDPWLVKWQLSEQDANLRYVIQTRAAENYYEINTEQIEW